MSRILDMVFPSAIINNGTGTGSLTSCIDGVGCAAAFQDGDVVEVWTEQGKVKRGEFVVSYVDTFGEWRKPRGWRRLFGKRFWVETSRIYSSDPLPAGTTYGDFLIVDSDRRKPHVQETGV